MGGYPFEEDCEFIWPHTLVLVGKTGNGKSATGNSILGMQMFQSKRSSSAVTTTSDMKTTALEDDHTLNVIDTPGLFDSSLDIEFVGKEISSCINMVKDGIDAFLAVISVRSRFSNDEKAVMSRLLTLFGRKFYDYMIIVFTGGDELEDDDESLEDFLRDSPKALQETLNLCGNRCVLFDNKTKDPTKRSNQVQKLLSLVNMVSKNNGGKPYSNEMFTELKKYTQELDEQQISVFDEQFKRIYEMVELKLKETPLRLEQQLAEEQTARLKAVENATTAQKKLDKMLQNVDSKIEETSSKLEQLFSKINVESTFKETTLTLEQVYAKMLTVDNGSIFIPEVLDLTEEDLIEFFAFGVSMLTSIALAIHYPSIVAAPHMLINGYKNVLSIAVATDYSFPLANKVQEYLADPSKFYVAAPVEEKKEEPGEESDGDMGRSLFD